MFSLSDWEAVAGVRREACAGGLLVYVDGVAPPVRRLLWGLSDFCVSSVSGPVVWLVPKGEQWGA